MTEEYRTIWEIMKEATKAYSQLGVLLGEIDGMVKKQKRHLVSQKA